MNNDTQRIGIETSLAKQTSEKRNPPADLRVESNELTLTSRWLNDYVHAIRQPDNNLISSQ